MKRRLGANRRGNMKNSVTIVTLWLTFLSMAAAQNWKPPLDSERCPSKWGNSDERSSMNNQAPDLVLKAARAIRAGELIELGRVLSDTMPIPTGRSFELYTKRTFMNTPSNHRGSNENWSSQNSAKLAHSLTALLTKRSAIRCTTASKSMTLPPAQVSPSLALRRLA